jgi:hypothetical protein
VGWTAAVAPALQEGERRTETPQRIVGPGPHHPTAEEEVARRLLRGGGEPTAVWRRSFGVGEVDGELWGGGPDYKVRFTPEGFEFTPAFGSAAPRNDPLSFALESVLRGDAPLWVAEASGTSPERDGNAVRYARAPWLEECYDVRLEGIEQVFTFATLPEGSGDLVVRGRLGTDLAATPGAGGGMRFEAPGFGAVTYGGVTGIDASGSTAQGSLRLDGDLLELVLPDAFVTGASFPLVLDPLIGSSITLSLTAADDVSPDVAYDFDEDLYLVVWERVFSGSDHDIRGQRVNPNGTLNGNVILVEAALASVAVDPAVADVNASDRFLVVWSETPSSAIAYDVVGAAVNAVDGAVSAKLTIAGTSLQEVEPDVGGDNHGAVQFDNTVVVWEAIGSGIQARVVNVPASPVAPTPSTAPFNLYPASNGSNPAISKHGAQPGNFLVVWELYYQSPPPGDHDVVGRVINYNGTLITPTTNIVGGVGPDEQGPDCATKDGTNFVIVYEREASSGSGDNDIHCRTAAVSAGLLNVGPTTTVLAGGVNDDEVNPAIDFAKSKYVVAWSDEVAAPDYDLFMVTVDPDTCAVCEPEAWIASGSALDDHPEVAGQSSGTNSLAVGDQALVVWQAQDTTTPFDSDTRAHLVEAIGAGGAVVDLGGGCGGGGTIAVNGPVALGNASFEYGLSGAAGPPVALILSPTLANFSCGPCTLRPALDVILAVPAPFASPTPCLLAFYGATFYAQWIVAAPGGCSLAPSLAVSSAISMTIGS